MILTIPNHRPVSWNRLYTQRHWSKRKALADEVHLLTLAAIPPDAVPFDVPVTVTITAYNRKPLDADNIALKLYVDGMKGRVLHDDDWRHVVAVLCRTELGDPHVVIEIQEANDDLRHDGGMLDG